MTDTTPYLNDLDAQLARAGIRGPAAGGRRRCSPGGRVSGWPLAW
jgi:hypothetical protein